MKILFAYTGYWIFFFGKECVVRRWTVWIVDCVNEFRRAGGLSTGVFFIITRRRVNFSVHGISSLRVDGDSGGKVFCIFGAFHFMWPPPLVRDASRGAGNIEECVDENSAVLPFPLSWHTPARPRSTVHFTHTFRVTCSCLQ